MLILNGMGAYIRFRHEKMGRKISKGNALCIRSYKSPFGIRILVRTNVFYHYMSLFILIENVIDNTQIASLSHFDEIFTSFDEKVVACLIVLLITLLCVLPYIPQKTG